MRMRMMFGSWDKDNDNDVSGRKRPLSIAALTDPETRGGKTRQAVSPKCHDPLL